MLNQFLFTMNTKLSVILSFSIILFSSCSLENHYVDYTLSPKDLLELNEVTVDEFDTKMARNTYHLKEKRTTENFSYSYQPDESQVNGKPYYNVTKYVNLLGKNKMILFMKNNNDHYADLKKKISELGFRFFQEETFQGQPTFSYMKEGNDQLIKITPRRSNRELFIIRVIFYKEEPFNLN